MTGVPFWELQVKIKRIIYYYITILDLMIYAFMRYTYTTMLFLQHRGALGPVFITMLIVISCEVRVKGDAVAAAAAAAAAVTVTESYSDSETTAGASAGPIDITIAKATALPGPNYQNNRPTSDAIEVASLKSNMARISRLEPSSNFVEVATDLGRRSAAIIGNPVNRIPMMGYTALTGADNVAFRPGQSGSKGGQRAGFELSQNPNFEWRNPSETYDKNDKTCQKLTEKLMSKCEFIGGKPNTGGECKAIMNTVSR
jgi:hypothetical protein